MAVSHRLSPETLVGSQALLAHCRHVQFAAGERLRDKGHHYTDMYLLTDGTVEVDLETGRRPQALVVAGAGQPIGEISFLRGWPATATVTARTPTRAVVIDDPALAALDAAEPEVAAWLLRHLADTAEERASQNLIFTPAGRGGAGGAVEILMCRNEELLRSAQQPR